MRKAEPETAPLFLRKESSVRNNRKGLHHREKRDIITKLFYI